MKITMNIEDGLHEKFMNSDIALPHHGLKVVIKHAKKSMVQDNKLKDYISKTFAYKNC